MPGSWWIVQTWAWEQFSSSEPMRTTGWERTENVSGEKNYDVGNGELVAAWAAGDRAPL